MVGTGDESSLWDSEYGGDYGTSGDAAGVDSGAYYYCVVSSETDY